MKRYALGALVAAGAIVAFGCGEKKAEQPAATATSAATAAATPTATATATSTPAPAANRFNPSKADAQAHASMIAVTDLPGGGWTVEKKDSFPPSEPATSAACAPLNATQKAFETALDTNRAGRAQVSMTKQASGALIPAGVEFQAYIFQDSKAAAVPLNAYRSLFDAAAFTKCLEEQMASDPSMTLKVVKGTPGASVPSGGVAIAYDISLTAGSISIALRVEMYAWQDSNAFVGVNMTGPKDVITAELATAAVTKFRSALDAAAKG